jgi:hypothetical protein
MFVTSVEVTDITYPSVTSDTHAIDGPHDDAPIELEAFGPWSLGEVKTVAEKKISPKAPAGTGAKKSGAQAATRITKKVKKVKKVK